MYEVADVICYPEGSVSYTDLCDLLNGMSIAVEVVQLEA